MATIVVPTDYVSIQEAVLAANEGDNIEVLDGNYTESVNVYKSNLTIEASLSVTMDGLGNMDSAFRIVGDNVIIRRFRILHYKNGIEITGDNNKIQSCQVVFNEGSGIKFFGNSNTITQCSIGGNHIAGISMGGDDNVIKHCTIDSNQLYGITSTTRWRK